MLCRGCGNDRLIVGERELDLRIREEEDLYRTAAFFGLDVEKASLCREEIRIPMTFHQEYQNYNALMKKIGLNLEPYQGKYCELYTWEISSPFPEKGKLLHLLMNDQRLIGGDISGKEFGSELKSLLDVKQN